jgi:4-carboxymuconolactone decarboxylase
MEQANWNTNTKLKPEGLGGRLRLLLPAELNGDQQDLYRELFPAKMAEAARGGYLATTPEGALIGPFNSYLYIPEIAQGYISWIEALHGHLPFEPEVREAVILTIGSVWSADFELYAHRAVAQSAAMPPEAVEALATGKDPEQLSERARVAQRFTLALVRDHEVDDSLYEAARRIFGDRNLVGLVHLIGLYLSVAAVLKAFRVPVPDAPNAGA